MPKEAQVPVALSIAGSDSGGGAGIQADLKTFAALGVHGASAITCITAQNPARVTGIHASPPAMVRRQIEVVFAELPPAAIKTGMLFSAEIIRAVVGALKKNGKRPALVVDPVMISTSGKPLLKSSAVKILKRELLPLATLVTPNLDEAARLTGRRLHSVEEMRVAAKKIFDEFGCAALIKGGHLRGTVEATDIFFDGETELLLTAPFVKGVRTHGTGCTYSAAITAFLALGQPLPKAIASAKEYVTAAIGGHYFAARHPVLEHFKFDF
ncbi:MAG TPA: bifunctional hydroxymethylpyrimidine kinase/phosphomethylpyrimidine kinase [Verrucomicrobiae bacterium]|nr:bifunctional hydroxymethylpyrimidine kinase/phosphomethylpyrimidine kinase [Verrucomicrobiae bacterium]